MTTVVQKSLLGLSVLMAIVLVAVLTSKKFTLESRRNALLLEMVANISTDLDKLDSGFDNILSRTEAAKGQLRRLAALHRDNLMICALLHEKHVKKQQIITEKTDQYDINIGGRACGPGGPGYPTPMIAMIQGALKTLDLGEEDVVPWGVRFLHDPTATEGFVGCAIMANVYRFFRTPSGLWDAEKVIDIPSKKVEGWGSPEIQGMITDILLSLDDKYLYFSNFLHGDVRQYDITDRRHPVSKGQVFHGGSVFSDSKIRVLEDKELDKQPDPVFVKGRRLRGAPQMLQLSLDGRRLYATTSLFSVWDKQFCPEQVKNGSTMVKLDIDVENGGMTLDDEFLVDFGADRDEILLAHEMRYPGGDCTSDIWLPEK